VVVPRGTPGTKCEKIQRYGAKLVVAASARSRAAESLARQIAVTEAAAFLPAVPNEDVVLGNGGSLGFEIVRGLGGVPERALAPIGAGSLATGLAWAFAADGGRGAERTVWGVQSEAWCAMATALESGRALDEGANGTPDPSTLAEELADGVSPEAFERAREAIGGVAVVDESQIAAAMVHAYQDMGLVLEGTAALALAPVLSGLPERLRGGDLVVVLTGRNIDPAKLDAVLAEAKR
jgi:threonine dehydratase